MTKMTIAMMTMRKIRAIIPLKIREFIEAKCSYSVTLTSFDVLNGLVMFFPFRLTRTFRQ
jgi:hypothetical protein